jgi:tetratricopeptide (TPR) repeat protein
LIMNSLDALKRNMRRALYQKRIEDAVEILDRLKMEDPLGHDTRAFELEFLLKSGRLAEARALSRQLCQLFPGSGQVQMLAGIAAYRAKNYPEAAARFRESLSIQPTWQIRQWLGKTLTQLGDFAQAESLLLSVKEENPNVLLDLCWLFERRNDLAAALKTCDEFLARHPGHEFATQQRLRLKAKSLEPMAFIEEVGHLQEFGETAPDALFPEYIQKLFDTGDAPRAREEVSSRMADMEPALAIKIAWVCHRAKAFDLAFALFFKYLDANRDNYKYLNALEASASRCNRLAQLIGEYRRLASHAPHLYGRCRSIARRYEK